MDSVKYDNLPDPNFDPQKDVVILKGVTVKDTYTGPKAKDSPSVRRVMLMEWQNDPLARAGQDGIEFDALTQLSLGFLAGNALKGLTVLIQEPVVVITAEEGTYTVYILIDKATNKIRYIGITSRTAEVRLGEHLATDAAKAGLRLGKTYGGTLTKNAARKLEQELILKNWAPDLLNKINSIAPKYWPDFGIKP